jgi:chemotaxis protein methyltransferase WspC
MHATSDNRPAAPLSAEALLQQWIGLDAQTIGTAAVSRAIQIRMQSCGESEEGGYLARLTRDTDEQSRFIDEIVVPESWFFRDPQVFACVQRSATMQIAAAGRTPIRILCVPCAAGEEPYSVAMALFDAGLTAAEFAIDAVDVSQAAVARASAATYSANAFRVADLTFRDRWFQAKGSAFQLDDAVRHQVRFSRGNLLDDSFATDREPYDIVFCRNLLIYLTSDARRRAEQMLDRLVTPAGLLAVGAAEPPILKGSWIPAETSSVFTLRRGTRPLGGLPKSGSPSTVQTLFPTPQSAFSKLAATSPKLEAASATPAAPSATLPPASATLIEPVAPTPSPVDDLLHKAGELAHAGRHAEALLMCQQHEQACGPCPKVFFLMGMLHQSSGDLERAEGCLHKTLYLDANHDEAFLALALVAMQRGDSRMAERYRQSATRALARRGDS